MTSSRSLLPRLALALALTVAALAPLPARAAAADNEGVWTPMATASAQIPRDFPAAVWTGTELLIWGGRDGDALKSLPIVGGGRYNPATDTWRPMATNGGPETWGTTVGVWTGSEAIFWSGQSVYGGAPGAAYHPDSDTWTPLPTAGAPGLPTSGQAAI